MIKFEGFAVYLLIMNACEKEVQKLPIMNSHAYTVLPYGSQCCILSHCRVLATFGGAVSIPTLGWTLHWSSFRLDLGSHWWSVGVARLFTGRLEPGVGGWTMELFTF